MGGLIQASGALSISAGGTVALLAQQTGTSYDETSHHTRSQGQTVTNVGTQVLAGTGVSITGSDILLQASHLAAPSVDLGAKGTIAFLVAHDVTASQVSGTQTGLFTQKILDHGRADESLVYPSITGKLTIHAGRIGVEYEAGQEVRTGTGKNAQTATLTNAVDGDASPKAVVTGLSAQAGLGWMAQVAAGDTPVTYSGLTTQHRQWDNDRTALSPAAQALIAVAVAVATEGMGAGIRAAVEGTTVAAATATAAGAATASAIGAAGASLISGTLIGAVNGDLDPGRLFLNAAVAGLTAGALNLANTQLLPRLGDALNIQPAVMRDGVPTGLGNPAVPTTQTFGEVVQNGLAKLAVDAPIRAGVQSLVGGGSFGRALLANLKSGAVADVLEPALFDGVGDVGVSQGLSDGGLGKVLLHAAVGAGGGYLTGGERGAVGGALGAGLNEAVSPLEKNLTSDQRQQLAQVVGAFGSLAAGDASMAGSTAALNGVLYNLQLHNTPEDIKKTKDLLAACDAGDMACKSKYQNALSQLQLLSPGGVYYSPDTL